MKIKPPCGRSDLVWVVWEDTVSEKDHLDPSDASKLKPATQYSVGWVLSRSEKCLVLAHEQSSTQEIDRTVIPSANIIAVIPIVKPRRRAQPETP